jgi:DNA-binding NarL/FixJ family response regulator
MDQSYSKIRVIIADDHEMVREGLQAVFKTLPDIEIIGEASNGEELVRLTKKLLPDVILTDVRMPKMNGIEATTIIKKEMPHIGIIALSTFDDETVIASMIRAGAKGYLLKDAVKQELRDAVKAAYRDENYYCKNTSIKLAKIIANGGLQSSKNNLPDHFTKRELQVIEMICRGLSSKEIANKLNLKARTVERYRDSIMSKMEVKNAAAVVLYAVEHGLHKKQD